MMTSSSGSHATSSDGEASGSGDDGEKGSEGSAPEEVAIARVGQEEPLPEVPLRREEARREEAQASSRPCRSFVATGRCRFQARCRFSHDKALRERTGGQGVGRGGDRGRKAGVGLKRGRMGLYERVSTVFSLTLVVVCGG